MALRCTFSFTNQIVSLLVCFVLSLGLSLGCANSKPGAQCGDGTDNDGDGLVDNEDPGCWDGKDQESPDPILPQCSDGRDNDNDGATDFPEDTSCENAEDNDEFKDRISQCRDGIDNDGDGLVDFPFDPGCSSPLENSESDGCPGQATCPACSNGTDDDGDGQADYPEDQGCQSASDNSEDNAKSGECGPTLGTTVIDLNSMVTGTLDHQLESELAGTCGGNTSETVYKLNVTQPTVLVATTNFPETTVDTVLYLRERCRLPATELTCNDDTTSSASTISAELTQGTYFLVVDSQSASASGTFQLQLQTYTLKGDPCDTANPNCAQGLHCRLLDNNATETTCELSQCADGIDNDGDTYIDFPSEPGCTSLADNDESDDCPTGAGCPECSDGMDNDLDGSTDYPLDTKCTSASAQREIKQCFAGFWPELLGDDGDVSRTTGLGVFQPSCDLSQPSPSRPENVYLYRNTRDLSELIFSTIRPNTSFSLDTVLTVLYESCTDPAAELACYDDNSVSNSSPRGEEIALVNPLQGEYFIVVDGDQGSGPYALSLRGTVADGASCDPQDTQFVCESDHYCDTTSLVCQIAQCSDGLDNDGDGNTDYPLDPGCAGTNDNAEQDDCPGGPDCPECSNQIDDDGDGNIDWMMDPGCEAAGDPSEGNCSLESDAVVPITGPVTEGTTKGATHDFRGSCYTTPTPFDSPDITHELLVTNPVTSLSVSMKGTAFSSVVYLKTPTCRAVDMACSVTTSALSPAGFRVADVTPGIYFIVVDGLASFSGEYTLTVHGEIKGGDSCDKQQEEDGLFVCEAGYHCDVDTCVETTCNNGIDDDGDGLVDFPAEPGCESISDSTEQDDCPTGPNCPQCSNDADDDNDGLIDFLGSSPSLVDTGCESASDDRELDPCLPGIEVERLTSDGAQGRTAHASEQSSNFSPSCKASDNFSNEDIYVYTVDNALAEITFSTLGSQGDTVLHVREGICGVAAAEVGCAQIESSGETLTLTSPSQGDYFVFVDGDYVSNINYQLSVSGIVASGGTCDPTSSQWLCEANTLCMGGICTPSLCSDGLDNDNDGLIDFPQDPGCTSLLDTIETDTCPSGADCPACSNQSDDDTDGATDYPQDIGCSSASDTSENHCSETDRVIEIVADQMQSTTQQLTDDYDLSCGTSTPAPDRTFSIILPGMVSSLSVSVLGSTFDTILAIFSGDCMTELGCNDDSQPRAQSSLTLTDLAAGEYFAVVDGHLTSSGDIDIVVSAELAPGEPCDPLRPFFVCASTESCMSSPQSTGTICQ